MKRFKYHIAALVLLLATFTWAGVNDRFSPIELSDLTGNIVTETSIQLASLFVDGSGPITNATAPNLTTVDNVGKVVWDNSGETAEIQFTRPITPAFAGMTVKIEATSSGISGNEQKIDWSVFYQKDGAAIGTVIAQTGVSFTEAAMDTTVDEIELTLNQAAINAITKGTGTLHVALKNASINSSTLEVSGIKVNELWKTN